MYKHNLSGSNEVNFFIEKSKPRFSFEANPNSNHFEFIKILVTYNNDYNKIVKGISCQDIEEKVISNLKKFEFNYFIPERAKMMEIILRKRFNKIRSICNEPI